MHALILTPLVVFFVWHAGLKALTSAAADRLHDDLGNLLRYAVVAGAAALVLHFTLPALYAALAAGSVVVLANVVTRALRAYIDAANPPMTVRMDKRPNGFR